MPACFGGVGHFLPAPSCRLRRPTAHADAFRIQPPTVVSLSLSRWKEVVVGATRINEKKNHLERVDQSDISCVCVGHVPRSVTKEKPFWGGRTVTMAVLHGSARIAARYWGKLN